MLVVWKLSRHLEAYPDYIKGEQTLGECAVPVAKKTTYAFASGVVGYGVACAAASAAPAVLTPLGICIVGGGAFAYGAYTYTSRIVTGARNIHKARKEVRAARNRD